MTSNVKFLAAAQGLCTVMVDNRHVASIATAKNGRWKLYAVKYIGQKPVMDGDKTVDVTAIYHHHDKLAEAVKAFLAAE